MGSSPSRVSRRTFVPSGWATSALRRRRPSFISAKAPGTNVCVLRQFFDAGKLHRTKNVARIFAGGDGGDLEIGGKLRWQILQAVHGEVNTVFEKGLFDFLGEHALGADFSEGNIRDFIARGLDDLKLHGMSLSTEQVRDMMGLPESKLRAARTDAESGRHSSAPLSGPGPRADLEPATFCCSSSLSLACRLKSRRTRSITVVDSGAVPLIFRGFGAGR